MTKDNSGDTSFTPTPQVFGVQPPLGLVDRDPLGARFGKEQAEEVLIAAGYSRPQETSAGRAAGVEWERVGADGLTSRIFQARVSLNSECGDYCIEVKGADEETQTHLADEIKRLHEVADGLNIAVCAEAIIDGGARDRELQVSGGWAR